MEKEIRVLLSWKDIEDEIKEISKCYERFYPGLEISLDKETLIKMDNINNQRYEGTSEEQDYNLFFMSTLAEFSMDKFEQNLANEKFQQLFIEKNIKNKDYDRISYEMSDEELVLIYYFDGDYVGMGDDIVLKFTNKDHLQSCARFIEKAYKINPMVQVYSNNNLFYFVIKQAPKLPITELGGQDVTEDEDIEFGCQEMVCSLLEFTAFC